LINLYIKSLLFKKGISCVFYLTWACNQDCKYCANRISKTQYPKSKIATLNDWKLIVDNLNRVFKVKEISLCGGEPTLVPYMTELANYCIEKGFHVNIVTNLYKPEELLRLKWSWRLLIIATYHHEYDVEQFIKNFDLINSKDVTREIMLRECEYPHYFENSVHQQLLNKEELREIKAWDFMCFAPDARRIYWNSIDLAEADCE
jgi:organic radical activating enzyme